jgi:16S rRNA processing protein RimM
LPLIALGRVVRAHGVHGAVLVAAYNESRPEAMLEADKIYLVPKDGADPVLIRGLSGKLVPKGVIVKLKGFTTREAAETLKGQELAVERASLPEPEEGEFYHADLLGLKALTVSGRELGKVSGLLETGSSLVLVLADESGQEKLIPFTDECVPEVDLALGLLKVAELPGLFD